MATKPTLREFWWAAVLAGVRGRFVATALVVMLAIDVWQFASGNIWTGLAVLGVLLFTYARIPALVVAAIVLRRDSRGR